MNCSEEDIRKPNRILWLWGTASVIFCVPVILLSGLSRSWNTSLEHPRRFRFGTVENPSRFWPEPNQYPGNEDASIPGRDHPSSSSNWYYWKLRPSDTDDVCDADGTEPWNLSCSVRRAGRTSRAAVWTLYVLHQTSMWALIYAAQRSAPSDRGAAYSNNLRWYNVAALGITALAHAAHLAQTHATYDGLAQDVAESSSQASVIVLLVFVLTMETGRRGLILGWPRRRRGKAEAAVQPKMEEGEAATIDSPQNCCCYPVADGPIELLRKYHGYFIVWATVYTFWYHPMESTASHSMGFLHTALLMVQASLMFNRAHLNLYWRVILESWVTVHAGVVALEQTVTKRRASDDDEDFHPVWPMFLFGFLWMFVFTQVQGLPYFNESDHLSPPKRLCRRLVPVALYAALLISFYATALKPFSNIVEIFRIPPVLYLLVLFVGFVAWLFLYIRSNFRKHCQKNSLPQENNRSQGTTARTVLPILITFICYAIMIAVSVIFETLHLQMNLMAMCYILVVIMSILALFSMVIYDGSLGRMTLDTEDGK